MVQTDGTLEKLQVTADGNGMVSLAGAGLLALCADRVGLTQALSRGVWGMRRRRGRHDPGRVLRDLALMLAAGGDSVCDLAALRGQTKLLGAVASDATARRAIAWVAENPARLEALRAARATARARAWKLGARPEQLRVDIDATLLAAYSQKEGAAGTFKHGFGHHPMNAYLDGSREALASILRPGNAGSNTAADQIAVVDLALEQLPRKVVESEAILVRADGAGAVHELVDYLRDGRINFSVGFDLTAGVRQAIIDLPEDAWRLAVCQDGKPRVKPDRDGQPVELAHVAELTGLVSLAGWPEGSRLIARRERLQGEEQLRLFADWGPWRLELFLTDQHANDIAGPDGDDSADRHGDEIRELDRRHRQHAVVEDRIREGKDTGMRNLPFPDMARNQVWLELVLTAQDLIAWTQALALEGELARCEVKRLRYRLIHQAGRLVRSARQTRLRLQRNWPWARELEHAYARLQALPAPAD
jgi:DDE family transposase